MNCLRKQQDNNSESTNKLIEKLKSNEYIMYGGNEVDEKRYLNENKTRLKRRKNTL
jgi:hypothetical protein